MYTLDSMKFFVTVDNRPTVLFLAFPPHPSPTVTPSPKPSAVNFTANAVVNFCRKAASELCCAVKVQTSSVTTTSCHLPRTTFCIAAKAA